MNQQINKNKIREKIQNTNTKDILYLTINSVENNSLKSAIAEIERFLSKESGEIIVIKN
jgi:hypothetical protein